MSEASTSPANPIPSLEQQKINRALAYREEADALFFQAQRGKVAQQAWLDKVADIEARYPYPTEEAN